MEMTSEPSSNTNERPSAMMAGGSGGDDALSLSEASGQRALSAYGVSLDSVGPTTPTHSLPRSVWNGLKDMVKGQISWDNLTRRHATSNGEALSVLNSSATGLWTETNSDGNVELKASTTVTLTDGTEETAYWVSRYGDALMNPLLTDRLSFFAYDGAANEFDSALNIEPQLFMWNNLSQTFKESVDFHFTYLLQVDAMYHASLDSGRLGRHNDSGKHTAYYNLYLYWYEQVKAAYLDTGLVTLPPQIASGHWTIRDVLDQLLLQLTPDGSNLHPDLVISARGAMFASTGITLGVVDDAKYRDSSGVVRFYNPQWQVMHDNPGVAKLPGTEVVPAGGDWVTTNVESASEADAADVVNAGSDASQLERRVNYGSLWANRNVDAATLTEPGCPWDIDNIVLPAGLTPQIVSFENTTWEEQLGRGFMLNLSEMIKLMRDVGQQLETELAVHFIPDIGMIEGVAALIAPPKSMNIGVHDDLYNLYQSKYMFKENPARKYTAAHMGPVNEKFNGKVGTHIVETENKTLFEEYWQPETMSNDKALKVLNYYAPGVETRLTAVGSVTLEELSNADMLNTGLISRAFGTNPSMHTKQEKPAIAPAGVTGAESGNRYSGGDNATAYNLVVEIVKSAFGGWPFFGTGHIPWTDVKMAADGRFATDVSIAGSKATVGDETYLIGRERNEVLPTAWSALVDATNPYEGLTDVSATVGSLVEIPEIPYSDVTGASGMNSAHQILSTPMAYPTLRGQSWKGSDDKIRPTMSFYEVISKAGTVAGQLIPWISTNSWGAGMGSLYVRNDSNVLDASDIDQMNLESVSYRLKLNSVTASNAAGDSDTVEAHSTTYTVGSTASITHPTEHSLWGRWGSGNITLVNSYDNTDWNHDVVQGLLSPGGGVPVYTDGTSIQEVAIGAFNALKAQGSAVIANPDVETIDGIDYHAITLEMDATFSVTCYDLVEDNEIADNGLGGSCTTTMKYVLLYKESTHDDVGFFHNVDGSGLEVTLDAKWNMPEYDGHERIVSFGAPQRKFDWSLYALPKSEQDVRGDVSRHSDVQTGAQQNYTSYNWSWIWPGDARVGNVEPFVTNGATAGRLEHAYRVSSGQTALFAHTDTSTPAIAGFGYYTDMNVEVRNTADCLATERFVGGHTGIYLPYQLPTTGILTTSGGKTSQLLALHGMGRNTCAVVVPDHPDNRQIYRPFRTIVDAAVDSESRRRLIQTGERYDSGGGLLGLNYRGDSIPFAQYSLIVDAGETMQYSLETDYFKTRLVDPSNRGKVTFTKVDMMEEGDQRIPRIVQARNAMFPGLGNRYATNPITSVKVLDTDRIRAVQIGRQYQRIGS